MPKREMIHAIVSYAASAVLFALAGCASPATPRSIQTETQLQAASAADAAQIKETFRSAIARLVVRADSKTSAVGGSTPPTLDILALSGGGDYGAFGAGFLVGWGSNSDPAWRRPDFDAVSGVSTGGLLAPFAYLGTDEACDAVETVTAEP